jgi:hypothetical protein
MADAKQGMVAGFNHNVKHRGNVYHVQTEDSGLSNPQIITHLFAGGNILASKKIFYGDIAEAENLVAIVRELMEEQHKDVLRGLVRGVYYDEAQALAPEGKVYQPGELAPPAPAQELAAAVPPPAAAAAPPSAAAPASPRPAQLPPPLPRARAAVAPPPLPPPIPLPAPIAAAPPAPLRGEIAETLFGEDLVSEKSLDEVILSYLAGERDAKK